MKNRHAGNNDSFQGWQDLKPAAWWSFVYLGQTSRHGAADPRKKTGLNEAQLAAIELPKGSLANTKVGDRVRIVALNCDDSNSRLMAMGLLPGVVLQVVSRTATGSVIVALQDHRLGLGAEMAQCIQVSDAVEVVERDRPCRKGAAEIEPGSVVPILKLQDAAIGANLKVVGYEPTAREYKRKLLAMGLTPGTVFLVKRHAPLGDPTEIEVRGFRLSLRKVEADVLRVEPV